MPPDAAFTTSRSSSRELALRLTPEEEISARQRRTILVAEHGFASGRFANAEELVVQLLGELPAGPERARALVLSVRAREENLQICAGVYQEALDEARGDAALEAEIHRHLVDTWIVMGDLGRATEHARLAIELTERTGDTPALAMALADLAHIESLTAEITPGLLERALELEEEVGGLPPWYRPSIVLGLRLMFDDRLDEARELLERAYGDAGDQADEYARAVLQLHLVQLEIRAGEWQRVEAYAHDSHAVFQESGSSNESTAAYAEAMVAAHLGRVEEARAWGARSLAASEAAGDAVHRLHVEGVLGFLELSVGGAEAAVGRLRPLPGIYAARGYGQPNLNPVLPDLIEALVILGELDEAEELVVHLEERGSALFEPVGTRDRGTLSSAPLRRPGGRRGCRRRAAPRTGDRRAAPAALRACAHPPRAGPGAATRAQAIRCPSLARGCARRPQRLGAPSGRTVRAGRSPGSAAGRRRAGS